MIRFCVLASGSRGNSIYIESPGSRILIDAGLSGKETLGRLSAIGVPPESLDALVVSHEHTDHIRGVGVLARRLEVPVYITRTTLDAAAATLKKIPALQLFRDGTSLRIGDMSLRPFAASHDAADPVNFVVGHEESQVGIVTDLGVVTTLARSRLKGCGALILETNHDMEMLRKGPYPPSLKQRILSRVGHLSNVQAARLLEEIHHDGMQCLCLAHLSEENNHRIWRSTKWTGSSVDFPCVLPFTC